MSSGVFRSQSNIEDKTFCGKSYLHLCSLKMSDNQIFSDVFRWYRDKKLFSHKAQSQMFDWLLNTPLMTCKILVLGIIHFTIFFHIHFISLHKISLTSNISYPLSEGTKCQFLGKFCVRTKMNPLLNSLQYLYVGIGCRDKILQSLLF